MAEVNILVISIESLVFSFNSSLVRPTEYLEFAFSIIEEYCSVRGSAYSNTPDLERRKFNSLLEDLESDLDLAAYREHNVTLTAHFNPKTKMHLDGSPVFLMSIYGIFHEDFKTVFLFRAT